MSDELLAEQDGPILRITINRSGDNNRVSNPMAVELTRLLGAAVETSRLVVLSAIGKDFCHGWTGPASGPSVAGAMEAYQGRREFDVVFDCYEAFRRAPIPILGVIRGRARGFGCALATACDITVAADTATFQIPEMGHNVLPTMVMWSLHDRVPYKALGYLAYTTAEIDAQRALIAGIVSEVVPEAKLDEFVRTTCAFLLKRPAPALLGLKEYLRSAPKMDAQGALDFGRNLHATINTSSEMKA